VVARRFWYSMYLPSSIETLRAGEVSFWESKRLVGELVLVETDCARLAGDVTHA
jgi:hypothetical protein